MKKITIALAAVAAFVSTHAFAQDDPRVRVSFGVGVAAGAISGEPIFGGSVGYKFSKHFSFDVDVVGAGEPAGRFGSRVFDLGDSAGFGSFTMSNLTERVRGGGFNVLPSVLPILSTSILPGNIRVANEGNTILSTAGFRYFIPALGDRFQPYLSGGLGVSRTEESFSLYSDATRPVANGRQGNTVAGVDFDADSAHMGMVLSGGVGASLRVFKALSLDIDARYYRLDRDRNLGSFGGGVSYRF
jgi:opacity protein-like surface antigen